MYPEERDASDFLINIRTARNVRCPLFMTIESSQGMLSIVVFIIFLTFY